MLFVRAGVITLTVKVVDWVALMASLVGTWQVAPGGTPLQRTEAVPLNPAPPIEREYSAVLPAVTAAVPELPVAILRPKPCDRPVPLRGTICGLLGAPSVTVRVPLNAPAFGGVKVR